MGITARARMARFLRSAPLADPLAGTPSGGGASGQQSQQGQPPAGQQGQPAAAPGTGGQQGQPGTPGTPTAPATGDQLGEAGLKALHAERDARKEAERRLSDTEKRLKELTDQRPADQKLADQLAEIQEELSNERIARLRSDAALTHQITPDNLPLLTGTTPDELTAQATRIAALQQAATAAAGANGTITIPGHQPHPGQGLPSGGEPPKKTLKDGADAYDKFKAQHAAPSTTST